MEFWSRPYCLAKAALLVQVPDKGETPGKDNADNWIRNKLKALANLLGKLADKALDALPGVIGSDNCLGYESSKRGRWLAVSESMGVDCGDWRADLYILGDEEITFRFQDYFTVCRKVIKHYLQPSR